MSDKKKPGPKEEKLEADMEEMNMQDLEMPMMGGMCPIMSGCPMMQPMMCPFLQMNGVEEQRMEYMRSPDWYDDSESDESFDDYDEYPGFWKQKKKYKYPPYPMFWPPFHPMKPYKKKHKKW